MAEEFKSENVGGETLRQFEAEQKRRRREEWVSTYAFFLAEARGFTPVDALGDWLQAERAYIEQGMAKGEFD